MNELKTFIGIRFDVEGFHKYPDASKNHGDRVKFLEQPHRHIFKFNCKKRVNHDNRDEEFILLKREALEYINRTYPIFETRVYDFGSLSCEMIATRLLKQFDFDSVEVSEDGENYAVVEKHSCCKKQEQKDITDERFISPLKQHSTSSSSKKLPVVIFVVGRAFSGKSFVTSNDLSIRDGDITIEVGEIVRQIQDEELRVFNKELDEQIAETIYNQLKTMTPNERVFIVGCRQKSIIGGLIYLAECDHLKLNYGIQLVKSSEKARRERFETLVSEGKNQGLLFEDIEKGDKSIGLDELILWCLEQPNCGIIFN